MLKIGHTVIYGHVQLSKRKCSKKCIIRLFRHCWNIMQCTYTKLDAIMLYTPINV